jgi:hypothetical protein
MGPRRFNLSAAADRALSVLVPRWAVNKHPEAGVRVWLVERSVDDRDLVTLVYATPSGDRVDRRHLAAQHLATRSVTAGDRVPEDDLEAVTEEGTRRRYATEAERVRAKHAPDDEL